MKGRDLNMKKTVRLMILAVLCAALLSGCGMSFHTSSGRSDFLYDNAESYTMGGASLTDTVEKVEVEWLSGSVLVTTHPGDTVEFEESANRRLNDDNTLYYRLEGTTLHIKFCRSGKWDFSGLAKDLTLRLPESLTLTELEVDSVSAEVAADAVSAAELKLNTVSGAILVTDCEVTEKAQLGSVSGEIGAGLQGSLKKLNAGSVSGSVSVSAGEIDSLETETTSGSISVSVGTAPRELEVDTVSGSVKLYLPEDAGFTLRFSTVSGSFVSDLPCKADGKRYVCGSGAGDYSVETTSGSLRIRAAE